MTREKAREFTAKALEWLERAETEAGAGADDGVLVAAEQTAAATIATTYASLAGLAYIDPALFADEAGTYGDNWRGREGYDCGARPECADECHHVKAGRAGCITSGTCGVPTAGTERCGLLAGHAGRHLSWPSGLPFPPDSDDPPAYRALHHMVERLTAENENQRATIETYRSATETLSADVRRFATERDELAAELERVTRYEATTPRVEEDGTQWYELPGAPVIGRRVQPAFSPRFQNATIAYERIGTGEFVEVLLHTGERAPGTFTWARLLGEFGRLRLLPLTEEELRDAELYGPIGERWGDPSQPCPWVQEMSEQPGEPWGPCALRLRHTGPHRDTEGRPMGQSAVTTTAGRGYRLEGEPVDIPMPDGSTVPGVIPADACTCGNPAEHQPGCPRYARVSGGK